MKKFCMGCMEQYEDTLPECPFCGYRPGAEPTDALHIEPGEILHSRYIVGKTIGFGGFGVTYIGWDALLEHKVAIKEYMPSEFSTRALGTKEVTVFSGKKEEQFASGLRKFHEEAKKLAKFNSDDGIVRVFDSFEENHTAYIVMELLEGEALNDRLIREKRIPYEEAVKLILPIATALKQVHQSGIIHRDIAPDNVFLTKDGKVKLIDFGAARFATTSHSRSLTVLIKPGFSPEEQYRSTGDQGTYTDVYALGALLYKMLTGETPPDALERRAFFEKQKKDILVPISKFVKDIPENLENAVYNAMNVRIEDRTQTAGEFIDELTTDGAVKRRKGTIKATDFQRWPLWAKITIPTMAAALVVMIVLTLTGTFRALVSPDPIYVPDGMARVPFLIGEGLENAEATLNDAVLLYSVTGKEYSSLIPENLILTQGLDSGSVVKQNSVVELVISGGAEQATVPNVEGMYAADARAALEELGFVVELEEAYSDVVAAGGVIAQSVEGDTESAVGSLIVLTVSSGLDPDAAYDQTEIEMPDLVGKTYEEAQKIAQEHHLLIIAKEKTYSDTVEKDRIMTQQIAAGEPVMTGTTIELTVSLGKHIVKMPDVVFRSEEEAKTLLERNDIKVEISYEESDSVQAGLVISQNVETGKEISAGTTVKLVVSKGGAAFAMPDVTGKSLAEAATILTNSRLAWEVSYEYRANQPDVVLSQSIAAGADVHSGQSIALVVSTNEKLVNVPDLIGKTEAAATDALKAEGFAVKVNRVYHDTAASGTVAEVSPAVGSAQQVGTTVLITVSQGREPVTVPDLVGKTQTEAAAAAKAAKLGFTVGSTEFSDTVPKGTVISQSPAAGAQGYKSDTVTVVVSKGKNVAAPTSLELSTGSLAMHTAALAYIEATLLPANADQTLIVSSSNEAVAAATVSGTTIKIGAFQPGTATLTVTNEASGLSKQCTITVTTEDVLSGYGYLVPVGKTITATVSNKYKNYITWSTANTSIASVSSSGVLSGSAAGETTLKAHVSYPISYSGFPSRTVEWDNEVKVIVKERYSATILDYDLQLSEGETHQLQYTESGAASARYLETASDVDTSSVTFVSSDTSVITVNENGLIAAVGAGNATVSLQADSKEVAYCDVTVASNAMSGSSGPSSTWSYNRATGELTIRGSGSINSSFVSNDASLSAISGDLRKIVIEEGVQGIGEYAFSGCTGVTSVSVPDTVTEIGSHAFEGMSSLDSVRLSNNLTTVASGLFRNCTSLTSISVPYGVTEVEYAAFEGCSALYDIIIPTTTSTVSDFAFYGTTSLCEITFMNPTCTIDDSGSCPFGDGVTIYGHSGSSIESYAQRYGISFMAL